jgi:mono/diheme cytochrome c family protein
MGFRWTAFTVLVGGALAAVITGVHATAQVRALPQPPAGVSVERGKYLVTAQDCNGCHTPFKAGEPDMTRMLSGHPQSVAVTKAPPMAAGWSTAINDTNTAWAGPWGISFTTNLTPDRGTGIGTWTEQVFISTIRNGKHSGNGRALLPPMPWKMYGQLSDDDLKSIFAYLRSIPSIANRVPQPVPAAPPSR